MKNQKLLKLFKMCIRKEQSDIIDKKFGKGETIKISSERGSITIFVVIAFIFCVTLLLGLYWKSANDQIVLLEEEQRIKEAYGRDVNNVENIYSKLSKPQDGLEEIFQDSTKVPYVTNYPIDVDGDGDPTDDWQVFYIKDYEGEDNAKEGNQPEKGRRVFLIASDYVKILEDTESAIQKSMKKSGMERSLDEDKKDYVLKWTNPYWTTCDLHLPDKEEKANIFPKLFEESFRIWEHQGSQGTEGSKCAATMLCTDNWSDFKDNMYADYAIGGPTYQMWINSWNMRHPDNQAYCQTDELGDLIGMQGQGTETYILNGKAQTDPLYLPHGYEKEGDFDKDNQIECCHGYWGASPCGLYGGNNLMMVGSDLALSDHWGADAYFGVRLVVCLKANVKLTPVENTIDIENAECFKIEI